MNHPMTDAARDDSHPTGATPPGSSGPGVSQEAEPSRPRASHLLRAVDRERYLEVLARQLADGTLPIDPERIAAAILRRSRPQLD
jgi:hypothetical protein